MKYKPFIIGMLLSIALIVTALLSYTGNDKYEPDRQAAVAVGANEVYNLINKGDIKAASERAKLLSAEAAPKDNVKQTDSKIWLWVVCGVGIVCVNTVIAYVWLSIIKPFHKLERYAQDIAAGNFENSLDYERSNYFGRFTWAFDSMRREIIKARSCEREAIENNKTVIASLSHDLKTPVASISAYSEALVNGLYSDTEEMYSYLDVISKKCGEISKITGDMLVHAVSELDALKMVPQPLELSALMETTVKETGAKDTICFEKPMFPVNVCVDKNRFSQLIGNIIGNAQKYADGKMTISVTKEKGYYALHFRDMGKGIADEDMPLVFDKFYRGGNAGDKSGSGLGLYIVKYIAEQSGGDVFAENKDPGLEITVTVPECKII